MASAVNPLLALTGTRLCAMNLVLHGIGGDEPVENRESHLTPTLSPKGGEGDSRSLAVVTKDALAGKHGEYDIVLANPAFGKKSSITIVNEAGEKLLKQADVRTFLRLPTGIFFAQGGSSRTGDQ